MTAAPEANPKLAARVARQIESEIIDAGWPVGTVLGSEAELRDRYGVSRSALREAVRIVEHHRVATMRRGRAGGLVVREPDATGAARALVIYLTQVGTAPADLMHARLLLEPLAAALAAQALTDEGLERLQTLLREESATCGPEAHGRFHITLGELSGNPVIALLVEILIMLTRHFADQRGMDQARVVQGRHESDHAHRKIVDATIGGDLGLTEHRMRTHLGALGDWLRDNAPVAVPTVTALTEAENGTDPLKLAEVMADRIRVDLAGRGLDPGEFVCSENDLVARYGTSKAVLREAIRLLEYHSVARMRRGPGGGLFVGRPDTVASTEIIALYLDYKGADFEAIRVARDAVELGCIDHLVARVRHGDMAQRLRETLLVEPDTPIEAMQDLAHRFHADLAELTANPVLVVFQQILDNLSRKHMSMVPSHGPALTPTELGTEVARTHRGIVDAILAEDAGLARYRMRRHLRTLSTQWWH